MATTLKHLLTPTAALLVSRAWVMNEVERVPDLDRGERNRLVDLLSAWEPPCHKSLFSNPMVWLILVGAAMLFGAAGLPAWFGFAIALGGLLYVAHELVVRQLRWKLLQLLREREGLGDAQPVAASR